MSRIHHLEEKITDFENTVSRLPTHYKISLQILLGPLFNGSPFFWFGCEWSFSRKKHSPHKLPNKRQQSTNSWRRAHQVLKLIVSQKSIVFLERNKTTNTLLSIKVHQWICIQTDDISVHSRSVEKPSLSHIRCLNCQSSGRGYSGLCLINGVTKDELQF